jgi:hypothetical protein
MDYTGKGTNDPPLLPRQRSLSQPRSRLALMKFMRGRRIGSMKISAARFLKNLDQIGRDFLQEGKCYVDQILDWRHTDGSTRNDRNAGVFDR